MLVAARLGRTTAGCGFRVVGRFESETLGWCSYGLADEEAVEVDGGGELPVEARVDELCEDVSEDLERTAWRVDRRLSGSAWDAMATDALLGWLWEI